MEISIKVRKIASNIIEYDVSAREPWDKEAEVRTYHANRTATFHGPHTGNGGARQLSGSADTAWRDTDAGIIAALKRQYRGATVTMEG